MRFAVGLFSLLLLGACATVPMASDRADDEGKRFAAPAPGMGALYIVRDTPLAGDLAPPGIVTIGTRAAGSMTGNTYFRFELPPGRYDVRHQSDNSQSSAVVDLAAGETRFVFIKWKIASFYTTLEVSPEEGRRLVLGARRAMEIQ